MTVRRITSVLFASVLLAGGLSSAQAAPARPHAMAHKAPVHRAAMHRTTMHKSMPRAMSGSTRRGAPMARGGDAQNGAVDQLNAQSLQRAQTGTPAQ